MMVFSVLVEHIVS